MDLTDEQFEQKYESELEILRDDCSFFKSDILRQDPFHVNDLELLNTYVIDSFVVRHRKKKGKYYICRAHDKTDGREFKVWSNFALEQEIDKFRKSSLAKSHKIHFWITKKRKSKNSDSIVAEINTRYHPVEKSPSPPPIRQDIGPKHVCTPLCGRESPPPCPCGRDYTDRGFGHNCTLGNYIFKKGRK